MLDFRHAHTPKIFDPLTPFNPFSAADFTSKWCTQHSLSENTANVLRENGFRNEATLRALKPEDVTELCLPSKAEEVLLREVLEDLHRKRYPQGTVGFCNPIIVLIEFAYIYLSRVGT